MAKAKPQPVDLDTIPADVQDVGLPGIQTFLRDLVPFFTTAGDLERTAQDRLVAARALTPPATGEQDAQVQRFILDTRTVKKSVEDHWAITTVVHSLHRRLTAARGRAIEPLNDAAQIAQLHHDRYVEQETRRQREEQARVQREAEAEARRARQAEQDALEQQRLEQEANAPQLSAREKAFILAYVADGRAVDAATAAGYTDPFKQSARLLLNEKIKAAVALEIVLQNTRQQQQVLAETPVVVDAPVVAADVQQVGTDRITWSAEVVDEQALIAAVLSGTPGIPRDVLQVDRVRLNAYARSLHELLDRWPGVQVKKTRRTV